MQMFYIIIVVQFFLFPHFDWHKKKVLPGDRNEPDPFEILIGRNSWQLNVESGTVFKHVIHQFHY